MVATDHNWELQLRKGVTELCVLASLRDAEAYGYELLQRLRAINGMAASEGTVYPLLARLLKAGALRQRTIPSAEGPPRRYYRLTSSGKKRLHNLYGHFKDLHNGIHTLMEGADNES